MRNENEVKSEKKNYLARMAKVAEEERENCKGKREIARVKRRERE